MSTIKAFAAFEQGGELKPYTYDPGPLADDQVEIAVEYCGICHSDLSVIDNEWGMSQYPVVPGHEICGQVIEVGKNVTQFKKGDLVGVGWFSGFCLKCESCLSGDHNYCEGAQPTIIGHFGGFADKVRAQEAAVVRIPESFDKSLVGPLLCAGLTVFNPLIQFGIKATDHVGVIGIGGLGHLALEIYRAWGCDVTAFTHSASKNADILLMGADHVVDEQNPKSLEGLERKFNYIISTVNLNLNWNQFLGFLKPRGRLHLVGVITEPMNISMIQLLAAQRSLSSSGVGPPAVLNKLMEFSAQHNIKPIVEFYSFDQINEAIEHLRQEKAHYRIVLKR